MSQDKSRALEEITMFTKKEAVAGVEMFPGVIRYNLAFSPGMMMVKVDLAEGKEVPAHKHEHEQIGYVLSGRLKFTVEDKTEELTAGDAYSVPANASHQAVALEDASVLDVFYPHREDWY